MFPAGRSNPVAMDKLHNSDSVAQTANPNPANLDPTLASMTDDFDKQSPATSAFTQINSSNDQSLPSFLLLPSLHLLSPLSESTAPTSVRASRRSRSRRKRRGLLG